MSAITRRQLELFAGRKPHLRALIGAVILMATRRMTYREAEDQIRHYGPTRYLSLGSRTGNRESGPGGWDRELRLGAGNTNGAPGSAASISRQTIID